MAQWLDPSAHVLPWAEIGPASETLIRALSELFWEGLTREISHAILSYKILDNFDTLPEEEDIFQRLPESVFHFIEPWAPWKIDVSREIKDMQESVAICMTERQRPNQTFRRGRMLLQGLTILDVDRLVQFREPLLMSQIDQVQVNIVQVPQASGNAKKMIHTLVCCECQRPIRSYFFECTKVCIHHDEDTNSRCNWSKHQYVACARCYDSCPHPKQHLGKVRPYDPLEVELDPPLTEAELSALRSEIKRLQKREDAREDLNDGRGLLRNVSRVAPKSFTQRLLPYGNVHTSVTLGPLVFEIGVRDSKRGVLVSLRRPPDLSHSENWRHVETESTTPAIGISPSRQVYTGVRSASSREIHASMKQVLGGVFSGHQAGWLKDEIEIIDCFTTESTMFEENPMKSQSFNRGLLRKSAERVVTKIKALLSDEVQSYLMHFASRITDSRINLTWDQYSNNCQAFCKRLLEGESFDTVLPREHPLKMRSGQAPRYLLSFTSENFGSFFDTNQYQTVPSAVYFREFHTGEDLIEYFDTWPTMPLHTLCSRLLCWPCLNAETCSLHEHMWLMPHETTSIIQLHLVRDRHRYKEQYQSDDPRENPLAFTDQQWMHNRLKILLALDSFLGAAGGLSSSYQEGIDILAEEGNSRSWKPRAAREIRLIQPPSKEGEYNFTLGEEARTLPLSKNRKMKRHLEKTAFEKGVMEGSKKGKLPLH